MNERPAPFGEQLVEPAEDGVAGDADEGQPVFLVRHRANPVLGFVRHLLYEAREILAAFRGASESVGHTEVDGAVGQRIEERRPVLVELQNLLPSAAHLVGVTHRFAKPVDVELDAGDALAQGDQFRDLRLHIAAIVFEIRVARPGLRARGARAGNIEREDRDVIHPLPDFRPLDVCIAGVRQHR